MNGMVGFFLFNILTYYIIITKTSLLKKKKISFIIIINIFILFLLCEFSKEWDILVFSQTWPYTFCHTWTVNSETHVCNLPANRNQWTIHGIWYLYDIPV